MARSDKMPGLNSLCTPAYLYFLISIAMLIFMGIFMNTDMMKNYCAGKCSPLQIILFFLIKLIFVIFWTWILNVLCRGGASWLAWFMVLFPFIMMIAVILTMFGNLLSTMSGYRVGPQVFPVQPNVVVSSGPAAVMPQPVVTQPVVTQPVVTQPMPMPQPMMVNGMPAPKM
jgi:hypothetical protein